MIDWHHKIKVVNMATNGANADGTVPAKGGKILVLPGDHIGPEVVAEALKVLDIIEEETGRKFERDFDLCGGCSLDKHKTSVTEEVLQKCTEVDAVFFGSAGGPEWGTVQPNPESGLLRIRDRMQVCDWTLCRLCVTVQMLIRS